MRRPTTRKVLLVLTLVACLAVQAQPTAGATLVVDIAAIGQRVMQIYYQYQEWQTTIRQYQVMINQIRQLANLATRYRANYRLSWRHAAPRDAYAIAKDWSDALNSGDVTAIANAQERISFDSGIYGLSAGERRGFGVGQASVQNSAVSVDLLDNAIREAMRSVGTYRNETEQLDREIRELQNDLTGGAQDRDALLQKSAIATMLSAAQARYTNRLLGASVEQQALVAMNLRDQKARSLASAVYGQKAGPGLWNFTKNPDIRTAVRY